MISWRYKINMKDKLNFDFKKYSEVFLEENFKHNLISKNDEKFLYEKHVYDSLSISRFFDKYKINSAKILDIGCGGGFPCVPVALQYKDFQITGIDSIQKKINAVSEIKQNLDIENLELIADRVENLKGIKFDIITSRAVATLSKCLEYALPILKEDGYFVAYKSKKADEEIKDAEKILKKHNAKVIDIIDYTLPLEEVYERKLVCVKKL